MNNDKSKILIVDDEKFYIDVLVDLLRDDYRTVVARDGEQAMKRVMSDSPPDLILLDVMMPGVDGHEVCRRLHENPATRDIPVIFLTVKSEVADELKGFELGANDYITKPMSPPIVMARVRTHLALRRAHRELADQNRILEQRVRERTEELSRTQDVAIYCMASLAETRDAETGMHIMRTQRYVKTLAMYLKDREGFREYLGEETIELLFKTAPLHDIGKVGVPDHILLKPGKLDAGEWEEMKNHAAMGHNALMRAEEAFGTTAFVSMAKEIALTHHEKWNGSGYPRGLKGNDIPISGRLMALADVYDALISARVYKPAMPHEAAVEIIEAGSGTHFDPAVVDAFRGSKETFKAIATEYAD